MTSQPQNPSYLPPLLDLDTSPVQGQIASAVLDLKGNMIRGQLNPQDASILFRMLVEVGSLKHAATNFRRMTVTFPNPSVRYVVARDETHVYIAQTRVS